LVDQSIPAPHLTVLDNIAFGLKLRGMSRSERMDRAMLWMHKVGLEGSEKSLPFRAFRRHAATGGDRGNADSWAAYPAHGRAFGALDPGIRLRMQELLIQLWKDQQATVFLVTHSVEEAVYLGDRVFLMAANPGRLAEVLEVPRPAEPPEESRRKPWFIEFCQALLRRLEDVSTTPPDLKV
jgi:NitT/TauT family transport system ATP-binding protein